MKNVFNAGFPGDTTVELLQRFDRDVVQRKADLVTLLVGSNDMFYPGHIISIEQYCRNLNKLLDRITVIGAGCILFTAPRFYTPLLIKQFPATLDHPLPIDERLAMLNAAIEDIASARSLPLIDLYRLITPVDDSAASMVLNLANSNYNDGMHLTADGYKIMAENVFAIICKEFRNIRNIVCLGDSITYGVYMPGKGSADSSGLTYPGQLSALLNQVVQ